MNERLLVYSLNIGDPDEAQAVGASGWLGMMPIGATLIYASVSPMEDDTGATMDIQDDGTDIVTAIACATQATPGEWATTHVGGAETPVAIAAGSELELDFNNAAAANRFDVTLWFLTGESWG
jgi:hypothetical protein